MDNGKGKGTALGAGVGMIFGAALGNIGVGMVLGAGLGLALSSLAKTRESE